MVGKVKNVACVGGRSPSDGSGGNRAFLEPCVTTYHTYEAVMLLEDFYVGMLKKAASLR